MQSRRPGGRQRGTIHIFQIAMERNSLQVRANLPNWVGNLVFEVVPEACREAHKGRTNLVKCYAMHIIEYAIQLAQDALLFCMLNIARDRNLLSLAEDQQTLNDEARKMLVLGHGC